MKSLLKNLLRVLPKQNQLYARQWARWMRNRQRAQSFAGSKRKCSCCGTTWSEFAPAGDPPRPGEHCLKCGGGKRQRLFTLFYRKHYGKGSVKMLHFAPETCLTRVFRSCPGLEYTSSDLDPDTALVQADITDLPFESETFDHIVCSHVLEHVPDDAKAMAEIYRVLAPGGVAFVMVPQDFALDKTYEDPSITDPVVRRREFGQHDHVRMYGPDLVERLAAAGFHVEPFWTKDFVLPEEADLNDLVDDVIYVCSRPS